ncbi:hypothetical protein [Streptomyces microflavus]|uniref:hypothetical protein n=1 Tax=Streptomyces microflavus TaxID=1919 RepID=UPI0033ACDB53
MAFVGSPGVVRADLPGAAVRPDELYGTLVWPTSQGHTSATPASQHVPHDASGEELVALTWEALELPGSAMDYHFVLQNAVDRLWGARGSDPAALQLLEVFALLDLELMEAAPQAVSFDDGDPVSFVRVTSVPRLIGLLEREGAFTEALALAQRLTRFEQGQDMVGRLSEKVGALTAEAAADGT